MKSGDGRVVRRMGHVFIFCTLLSVVLSSVHILLPNRSPKVLRLRGPKFQSCPLPHLDNGRVTIRSRNRGAVFRCGKKFQLFGQKFSTCVRGHWTSPPPVCVKPGCPPVQSIANGIVRPNAVYRNAVLDFSCYPGYLQRGSPVLFCDGKNWNSSTPTCEADYEKSPVSCDFETDDICGWTQETSSAYGVEWFRRNGSTPSRHVGTGPLYDHTLGQGQYGHYLYIESSTRGPNTVARIFSPVYRPELSQDSCFIFWYHMYGLTTGSLKVYIKPEGVKIENVKPVFQKIGEQGDIWLEGVFNISKLEVPFQVVIEGVREEGFLSDIAFDDVRLDNGSQCIHYTTTTTTQAVKPFMPEMYSTAKLFLNNTSDITYPYIEHPTNSESTEQFSATSSFMPTKVVTVTVVPINASIKWSPSPNMYYSYNITPTSDFIPVTAQLTTDAYTPLRDSRTQEPTYQHSTRYNFSRTPAPSSRPLDTHISSQTDGSTKMYHAVFSATTSQTTRHATSRTTTQNLRANNHTTLSSSHPSIRTATRLDIHTKVDKPARPITTDAYKTSSLAATTPRSISTTMQTKKQMTKTTSVNTASARSGGKPMLMTPGSTQITGWLQPRISAKQRSEKSTLPLAVGGTVIVVLAGICAAVLAFIFVRRRRRRRQRDNLSDDSDVRFLTADEILDFTLATPKEYRDDDV